MTAGVAAVLALHAPVRRYQAAGNTDTLTYPSPERALQVNRRHPMRGYESLVMAGVDDIPFLEVCGECSRVENAGAETVNGYGDDHDDAQDGTELSMNASAWPCATYTALADADTADVSNGSHRVTEDSVFDDLWGRQFPTGGRDKWIYLDANAARAIAKRVVTAAREAAGAR